MRLRRHPLPVLSIVLSMLGVSCSPNEVVSTSTTTVAPTTTSIALASTSTSAATTTTRAVTTTTSQGDTVAVHLSRFGAMGPAWTDQVFPYGVGEDRLGTAPGGDGLMLGPEYGTQIPDRTWWFMDAAKLRIARYASDGSYRGQILLPEDVLVDGQYFQYQNPIALDDGSVIASGFRGEANSALLTVSDDLVTSRTLESSTPWVTTDGRLLFGFSLNSTPESLDPEDDEPTEVQWFMARDGSRYMVGVTDDEVIVTLPDVGVTKTLQMRFSEEPDVEARAGIEVETGSDGTLYILFYGAPTSDETLGIGGLVTVSPEGHVSDAEPIIEPFGPADPGSPSHLGVTPGTNTPWLMVVAEDGVHVFTKNSN